MDEPRDTSDQPRHPDADEERPLPLDQTGAGETEEDPVDDASADSFPASDPPSFTGSTTD